MSVWKQSRYVRFVGPAC